MRISRTSSGYIMWLSESDTYSWATREDNSWPLYDLRGKRVRIGVDSNGLCDLTINGQTGDCNGTELDAIVSDHLPTDLQHLWPTWKTK